MVGCETLLFRSILYNHKNLRLFLIIKFTKAVLWLESGNEAKRDPNRSREPATGQSDVIFVISGAKR